MELNMAMPKGKWSIVNIKKFEEWRKKSNIPVLHLMKDLQLSRNNYYNWLSGRIVALPATQRLLKKMMTGMAVGNRPGRLLPKTKKASENKKTIPANFKLAANKPPAKLMTKSIARNTSHAPSNWPPLNPAIVDATASVVTNFMTTNQATKKMSQKELVKFIQDIKNAFVKNG